MEKQKYIVKKDLTDNWAKAITYIPKETEILFYTDMSPIGIKIGNGKNTVLELPFINSLNSVIEDDILIIN